MALFVREFEVGSANARTLLPSLSAPHTFEFKTSGRILRKAALRHSEADNHKHGTVSTLLYARKVMELSDGVRCKSVAFGANDIDKRGRGLHQHLDLFKEMDWQLPRRIYNDTKDG